MKRCSPLIIYCAVLLAGALLVRLAAGGDPADAGGARAGQENKNLLQHARLSAYTAGGRLTHRLQSPQLWHFSDGGEMQLAGIEFAYHPQTGAATEVTAGQGVIKGEQIYLNGEVEVRQAGANGRGGQRLTTRDVTISLPRKTAHTDQPAVLHKGSLQTRGVGMVVDLEKSEIRLLSAAKTTHER